MIITPVNWYQAPSGLKSMIDRLVCADGGNPDPTSTHGKTPEEAKAAVDVLIAEGLVAAVGQETAERLFVRAVL